MKILDSKVNICCLRELYSNSLAYTSLAHIIAKLKDCVETVDIDYFVRSMSIIDSINDFDS